MRVNEDGCFVGTDSMEEVVITDVEDVEAELVGIHIYPNPASGQVTIDLPDDMEITYIRMVDLSGRIQLASDKVCHSLCHLDLSGFASGVYILEMVDDSGRKQYTQRVIRE